MPASRKPDPLREMLDDAESDLSRRLREACEVEARGVSTKSSAEIRRLEDTLLAAAMAAARTLAARKHLGEEKEEPARTRDAVTSEPKRPVEHTETSDSDFEPPSTAVREFQDESGRTWRAWPVTPGMGRARESMKRGLGDFQDGWICFEALDNSGRRRLPRREPRWSELPPEELKRMLAEALDAPGRKSRGATGAH